MKKILIFYIFLILISGCNQVQKRVDSATDAETKKLEKFLNKSEEFLKIELGVPDKEILDSDNKRILVYNDSKFKIRCQRQFEIDPKNIVIAFSSKNCF